MTITAKMIAKELGISPSAVSFALNGKSGVSEATRQMVLEKANELGYFSRYPDSSRKVPRYIRFIIYRGGRDVLTKIPFYPNVLQGAEICARELGYEVLVSYCDRAEFCEEQLMTLCKDVVGILVMGTELQKEDPMCAALTGKLPCPVVVLDNGILADQADCVVTDNTGGAYKAIRYLAECGHKSVGYLSSKQRIQNFNERTAGVKQAMQDCPELSVKFIEVSFATKESVENIKKWIQNTHPLPTALFADSDMIAFGALQALSECGYRVPEDVSVIGFGDMESCTVVSPPLTTIRVMKQQMGISAMMLLQDRIDTLYPKLMEDAYFYLTIGTSVKIRKSVCRINAG